MSFRGASAGAFAALRDDLDSMLAGDPASAAQVGKELFGVSGVLRSEASLRRVVTDLSVADEAKVGLVREVFGAKVSEAVVALASAASGRRWTAPRDLADALEQLGVLAIVKSAGDDAGRLSDELFEVGQLVKTNPELRDALSDPARSQQDKGTLVRALLEGKALPATIDLVEQSLAGTHRTVGVALAAYQQVAAEAYGQSVAEVRVARPLSDADRQRLEGALSRQYGRAIHLNVVVDPDVIGGLRVEIGDDVIDGTVSSRLSDAGRKLAG
ncbi:F0F1 ATP synthase subunit delta [Nocardioides sp. AE5]|uniref:F0F1 ATP synthase subunit delta n=1 Tax=Nocardioides sp. AE5 TaxID=2962573 RepID=UPI002881D1D5|nr:F0F1 ATP synthase subunit delta [Nocardioides sp. AE5]MDT0200996.1 F0F1 ATP synthase subunit delta [Nocardioides sp. AE5]